MDAMLRELKVTRHSEKIIFKNFIFERMYIFNSSTF